MKGQSTFHANIYGVHKGSGRSEQNLLLQIFDIFRGIKK